MRTFIKNVSYSFLANFITLTVAVIMTMVVPKFISVYEYGCWQLFLFYYYYIGFFHFGWEDGIYLRYGGQSFSDLNRNILAGQFYGIILTQCLIAVLLWTGTPFFIQEPVKVQLIRYTAVLLPFVNFNNLCNFIMQLSNRIKDYAALILTEQVVFIAATLIFLLVLHNNEFVFLYAAKALAVICVTCAGIFLCRSFLWASLPTLSDILAEFGENISVGVKLMFANVAGMLIIGIVRYGISEGWDIATFGKISLTLNISNFLLVFINAVSIVLFPTLKQLDDYNKLASLYCNIRTGLVVVLLGAMLLFYPLELLLSWWLPDYADSLAYMAILFPICLFESKMQLLCTTFLKSMRQETLLLRINVISVLLSIVGTVLSVLLFHNISMGVFTILVLYIFRCLLAEFWLQKLLKLKADKTVFAELILVVLFVACSWYFNNWKSTLFYGIAYLIYVYTKRFDVYKLCCNITE